MVAAENCLKYPHKWFDGPSVTIIVDQCAEQRNQLMEMQSVGQTGQYEVIVVVSADGI